MKNTNTKFTKRPIKKALPPFFGGRKVVDESGAVMCFLFLGKLYDLNHVCFASCKRVENVTQDDDPDAFVTDGRFLYRNGQVEGRVLSNAFKIAVTILVTLLVLATISLIVVANVIQQPAKPSFTVVDIDGEWGKSDQINIFGENKVKPGDSGSYSFLVNNLNDYDLNCLVRIKFNNDSNALVPPIRYKLETGGQYLTTETKDGYLEASNVKIYKNDSRSFYLEWEWLFDGDSDEYDTAVGILGKDFSVTIEIVAEQNTKQR